MTIIYPNTFRLIQINDGFPTRSKRSYSRDCKNIYSRQCLISGLSEPDVKLAAHHLFNCRDFPLLELCVFNSVCISTDFHKEFHKLYGIYCTPTQFLMYIDLCRRTKPELNVQNLNKLSAWVTFLDREIRARHPIL
jgi:hypothetical protein